jgi:small-conductance mechanosensitive channel
VDWTLLNREIVGIRISALLVAGAVLALVVVGHAALRWWIRRKARLQERETIDDPRKQMSLRRWLPRALREMVPPLAFMIWISGLRLCASLLIAEIDRAETRHRLSTASDWAYGLLMLAAAVWLLARLGKVFEEALVAMAARSGNTWDDLLLPFLGKACRRLLPLLALVFGVPALKVPPAAAEMLRTGIGLMLIAAVGVVLYQLVDTAAAFVLHQHRVDVTDNLHARAIQTQVVVLKRVAVAVIVIFTVGSMLMVFASVRQFGASILASAGIAGIIVGLAAQRSIGGLIAGFQIALTQPIRMDDVVIVEGEFGRIEEITLTYVVVRLWDLRRLIVPISNFIDKPFQNWTRSSADLLATVFLYVDYTMPVAPLRAELTRILEASPRWDRKVNVLQVTDSKERTVEIRALASAADASIAWDLRCEVREKLVDFLQREYPECLPRLRGAVEARVLQPAAGS